MVDVMGYGWVCGEGAPRSFGALLGVGGVWYLVPGARTESVEPSRWGVRYLPLQVVVGPRLW